MLQRGTVRRLFEGQATHAVLLALSLVALYAAVMRLPGGVTGSWRGVTTPTWIALAVGNAILHQLWVWACWRIELHTGRMSRRLGSAAFPIYAVVFSVLILARPVLLVALGLSNRATAPLDRRLTDGLALLVAIPALWTFYSVARYFGFRRAYGIDHFDPAYRGAPLVRRGIFRHVPNAMYTFGLLALWLPGLLLRSTAALLVAAFSHVYIWVHYLCTERPDMRRIYGRPQR